jgi:cytochrome c biogenesis protein CcmG, thiol:disulfide interchange protein DsbE
MKRLAFLVTSLIISISSFSQEEHKLEEGKKIPAVQLKTVDGKSINTAELGFKGPVIFSFWATWCSPCKRELNTIHDLYTDWQSETGVNLVAVSVDDMKNCLRCACLC